MSDRLAERAVIDALEAGVWMVDRDGVTVHANPPLCRLLGIELDDMVGHRLLEFFAVDDHPVVLAHLRSRRAGVRDSYDARLRRPDGSTVHVRVQGGPLVRDGVYVGAVAAITDLTDVADAARERDAALERAQAVALDTSRFVSWMSHEVRTPLNSISGYAQLLRDHLAGTPEQEMAERILAASELVNSLVNDVLDVAKADADLLEPELTVVPLRAVLDDALGLVANSARDFGVRLRVDVGVHHVLAARRHLLQVLVNVLSNAVKYGGRDTTVTVTSGERDGRVWCSVHDEGPGIPADLQRRAFRPFERLDNSSGVTGVGLGLSIADSFTRAMKGTLTLSSPPGEGATFTIELTRADADRAADAAGPPTTGSAERYVLYVEDEPLNASLVESIVALLPGRRLRIEPTVAAGISAVEELRPALLLLDLNLPDGSGLDVLQAVRAVPHLAHTPVFVLSADATEQASRRALDLGADRFITKPFDLKEFMALIDATT